MLYIKNIKGVFKLRVAAVLRREGKILLLNEPLAGTYWILPGGRAEMHESTDTALARELEEEMGGTFEIGRLLWVVEDFFTYGDTPTHTIGFYYSVDLPTNHPLCSQDEYRTSRDEEGQHKQFHFRWCSQEEILNMEVYPTCVKALFPTIDNVSHIHHCVIGRAPKSRRNRKL